MSAFPGFKPWRTIQTGPTSDAFREGWERLFGKKPEPAEPPKPKDESPDAPKT